ncbi:MAG TPA: L-arabinose isomerase [Phycisphaerae bacterium]|nr:L-arabinose isomerase [Phycisphaerae bacterium]HQL72384.1 L-arabinose isomerase [Phycisphaerae bacterium]
MAMALESMEIWFVTGSQDLYGPATLKQVARNSREVVDGLNASSQLPVRLVFKDVVTSAESILRVCQEASAAKACAGVVCWMHTFSPAKMWIAGLSSLRKPLLHLHTQFNRDLPWSSIDMDFMNLNQAAHGDREFGFICSRMRLGRKVVVGHWQEAAVQERLAAWMRAAAGAAELRGLKVARLGDNMRQVAVTEGDKVEAQIRLGFEVNGYGVGELAARTEAVSDAEIDAAAAECDQRYAMAGELQPGGAKRQALRYALRVETALRGFLVDGGFGAFTDTFEDLAGLAQLPGLAVQRLMAEGYGFAAEGDWKTAALVRALKVMGEGLEGGASFMEDYTYHFGADGAKVLGAHMLEVCPTLAQAKPSCEVHPLGIGGKDAPVRLVFTARGGPAINVSMIDLGDRFRLLMNEVDAVEADRPMPALPVARALWTPRPDLPTAAAAWIYSGGAHHTAFSQAVTGEMIEDLAEMSGLEYVPITATTSISDVRNQLRWNEAYYGRRS